MSTAHASHLPSVSETQQPAAAEGRISVLADAWDQLSQARRQLSSVEDSLNDRHSAILADRKGHAQAVLPVSAPASHDPTQAHGSKVRRPVNAPAVIAIASPSSNASAIFGDPVHFSSSTSSMEYKVMAAAGQNRQPPVQGSSGITAKAVTNPAVVTGQPLRSDTALRHFPMPPSSLIKSPESLESLSKLRQRVDEQRVLSQQPARLRRHLPEHPVIAAVTEASRPTPGRTTGGSSSSVGSGVPSGTFVRRVVGSVPPPSTSLPRATNPTPVPASKKRRPSPAERQPSLKKVNSAPRHVSHPVSAAPATTQTTRKVCRVSGPTRTITASSWRSGQSVVNRMLGPSKVSMAKPAANTSKPDNTQQRSARGRNSGIIPAPRRAQLVKPDVKLPDSGSVAAAVSAAGVHATKSVDVASITSLSSSSISEAGDVLDNPAMVIAPTATARSILDDLQLSKDNDGEEHVQDDSDSDTLTSVSTSKSNAPRVTTISSVAIPTPALRTTASQRHHPSQQRAALQQKHSSKQQYPEKKERHYDVDEVRAYIHRQAEQRKQRTQKEHEDKQKFKHMTQERLQQLSALRRQQLKANAEARAARDRRQQQIKNDPYREEMNRKVQALLEAEAEESLSEKENDSHTKHTLDERVQSWLPSGHGNVSDNVGVKDQVLRQRSPMKDQVLRQRSPMKTDLGPATRLLRSVGTSEQPLISLSPRIVEAVGTRKSTVDNKEAECAFEPTRSLSPTGVADATRPPRIDTERFEDMRAAEQRRRLLESVEQLSAQLEAEMARLQEARDIHGLGFVPTLPDVSSDGSDIMRDTAHLPAAAATAASSPGVNPVIHSPSLLHASGVADDVYLSGSSSAGSLTPRNSPGGIVTALPVTSKSPSLSDVLSSVGSESHARATALPSMVSQSALARQYTVSTLGIASYMSAAAPLDSTVHAFHPHDGVLSNSAIYTGQPTVMSAHEQYLPPHLSQQRPATTQPSLPDRSRQPWKEPGGVKESVINVHLRRQRKHQPVQQPIVQQHKRHELVHSVSAQKESISLGADAKLDVLSDRTSSLLASDSGRDEHGTADSESWLTGSDTDSLMAEPYHRQKERNLVAEPAVKQVDKVSPATSSNQNEHEVQPGPTDGSQFDDGRLSPTSLHSRLRSELQMLADVEEGMRQLSEAERTRAVALAQQETVSLAQILKARQYEHQQQLDSLSAAAKKEKCDAEEQLKKAKLESDLSATKAAQEQMLHDSRISDSVAASVCKAAEFQTQTLEHLVKAHQGSTSTMLQGYQEQVSQFQHTAASVAAAAATAAVSSALAQHSSTLSHAATHSASLAHVGVQVGSPTPQQELLHKSYSVDADSDPTTSLTDSLSGSLTSQSHLSTENTEEDLPVDALASSVSRHTLSTYHSSFDHSASSLKHSSTSCRSVSAGSSALLSLKHSPTPGRSISSGSSALLSLDTANRPLSARDSSQSHQVSGDLQQYTTDYSLQFEDPTSNVSPRVSTHAMSMGTGSQTLPSQSVGDISTAENSSLYSEDSSLEKFVSSGGEGSITSPGASSLSMHDSADESISIGDSSFAAFTLEMVRQLMQDEETRSQHQAALLGLREKAVREKARAELALVRQRMSYWERKGADDKMPPLRKRQEGLLQQVQAETAELKRLQSANEAARQDRKLLLQQQQDIARLREKTKLFKQRFRRRSKQTSITPIQSPLRARSPTPQTLLKHSTPLHGYASVVSLTSDSFHGQPATDSRTQNLSSAASITSLSDERVVDISVGDDLSMEDASKAHTSSFTSQTQSSPSGDHTRTSSQLGGNGSSSILDEVTTRSSVSKHSSSYTTDFHSEGTVNDPSTAVLSHFDTTEEGTTINTATDVSPSHEHSQKQTPDTSVLSMGTDDSLVEKFRKLKEHSSARALKHREKRLATQRAEIEKLLGEKQHIMVQEERLGKEKAKLHAMLDQALHSKPRAVTVAADVSTGSVSTKVPSTQSAIIESDASLLRSPSIQSLVSSAIEDESSVPVSPAKDGAEASSVLSSIASISYQSASKSSAGLLTSAFSDDKDRSLSTTISDDVNTVGDVSSMMSSGRTFSEARTSHTAGRSGSTSMEVSSSESFHDSEQSDVEARISALREQLRNRRKEAKDLEKQRREHRRQLLRQQEAVLKKKLEDVEATINSRRAELDHPVSMSSFLSSSSASVDDVRDQVKSGRAAYHHSSSDGDNQLTPQQRKSPVKAHGSPVSLQSTLSVATASVASMEDSSTTPQLSTSGTLTASDFVGGDQALDSHGDSSVQSLRSVASGSGHVSTAASMSFPDQSLGSVKRERVDSSSERSSLATPPYSASPADMTHYTADDYTPFSSAVALAGDDSTVRHSVSDNLEAHDSDDVLHVGYEHAEDSSSLSSVALDDVIGHPKSSSTVVGDLSASTSSVHTRTVSDISSVLDKSQESLTSAALSLTGSPASSRYTIPSDNDRSVASPLSSVQDVPVYYDSDKSASPVQSAGLDDPASPSLLLSASFQSEQSVSAKAHLSSELVSYTDTFHEISDAWEGSISPHSSSVSNVQDQASQSTSETHNVNLHELAREGDKDESRAASTTGMSASLHGSREERSLSAGYNDSFPSGSVADSAYHFDQSQPHSASAVSLITDPTRSVNPVNEDLLSQATSLSEKLPGTLEGTSTAETIGNLSLSCSDEAAIDTSLSPASCQSGSPGQALSVTDPDDGDIRAEPVVSVHDLVVLPDVEADCRDDVENEPETLYSSQDQHSPASTKMDDGAVSAGVELQRVTQELIGIFPVKDSLSSTLSVSASSSASGDSVPDCTLQDISQIHSVPQQSITLDHPSQKSPTPVSVDSAVRSPSPAQVDTLIAELSQLLLADAVQSISDIASRHGTPLSPRSPIAPCMSSSESPQLPAQTATAVQTGIAVQTATAVQVMSDASMKEAIVRGLEHQQQVNTIAESFLAELLTTALADAQALRSGVESEREMSLGDAHPLPAAACVSPLPSDDAKQDSPQVSSPSFTPPSPKSPASPVSPGIVVEKAVTVLPLHLSSPPASPPLTVRSPATSPPRESLVWESFPTASLKKSAALEEPGRPSDVTLVSCSLGSLATVGLSTTRCRSEVATLANHAARAVIDDELDLPFDRWFASYGQQSDKRGAEDRSFQHLIFSLVKTLWNDIKRKSQASASDTPLLQQFRFVTRYVGSHRLPPRPTENRSTCRLAVVEHIGDLLFGKVAPKQSRQRKSIWRRSGNVFHSPDSIEGQAASEMIEEEHHWTDYGQDEAAVKESVADEILNSLLDETVALLSSMKRR